MPRAINDKCNNCGNCVVECLSGAISSSDIYRIDPAKCIDCLTCVKICKQNAITEYVEPIVEDPNNKVELKS